MKTVRMNLMKEFGEETQSEIMQLINTCCQNISEYEESNNEYLAEIKNNISYFQNAFNGINDNVISKLNDFILNYKKDDIASIIQKSNRKMRNNMLIDQCNTERKIYKKIKNADKMKKFYFIKDNDIVSETFSLMEMTRKALVTILK